MVLVAGVDGIKGGWVFVLKAGAEIALGTVTSFSQLLRLTEAATAVAVDIPIGLMDAACRGGRECDRLARQMAGPAKAPAIFSPPCRGALKATSYAEANKINRDSSPCCLGLSQQAYALFGKLREVDAGMTPGCKTGSMRCIPRYPLLPFERQWRLTRRTSGHCCPRRRARAAIRGSSCGSGWLCRHCGFDQQWAGSRCQA